jgi:hypothetical protein
MTIYSDAAPILYNILCVTGENMSWTYNTIIDSSDGSTGTESTLSGDYQFKGTNRSAIIYANEVDKSDPTIVNKVVINITLMFMPH